MLALLERFQTVIVGTLGFAGVIVTLFVNAYISRRQSREAREHEGDTIRQALLAELRSARLSAKGSAESLREGGATGDSPLHVNAEWETPVFDGVIPRLGLLGGEQTARVVDAYMSLRQFDRALALFSAPDESGHFRRVTAGRARTLAKSYESLLPKLDSAIAALDVQ